jgi:hypothetical protein
MKMKTLFAIMVLAVASPCIAQAQSTGTAAAPGCGPDAGQFDVKTDQNQHPTAAADATKVHIYFLQDDDEFLSMPRPTTRFGVDGTWVGATHSNSYFYVAVGPGEHHLCASWQGFVGGGLGSQRREAALHFTAEAGTDYYFRAKDIYGPKTGGPAVVLLKPLDSDEAQLLMSQFSFSTSTPKK